MKIPTPLKQTFLLAASCFALASYAGAIDRISLYSTGNEVTSGVTLHSKLAADGKLVLAQKPTTIANSQT
jgi:hypothetical protein